jgi:hypothetical protein
LSTSLSSIGVDLTGGGVGQLEGSRSGGESSRPTGSGESTAGGAEGLAEGDSVMSGVDQAINAFKAMGRSPGSRLGDTGDVDLTDTRPSKPLSPDVLDQLQAVATTPGRLSRLWVLTFKKNKLCSDGSKVGNLYV